MATRLTLPPGFLNRLPHSAAVSPLTADRVSIQSFSECGSLLLHPRFCLAYRSQFATRSTWFTAAC